MNIKFERATAGRLPALHLKDNMGMLEEIFPLGGC